MKINKSSWHYKCMTESFMYDGVPVDFCGYWRSLIAKLGWAVLLGIFGGLIFTCMLTSIVELVLFITGNVPLNLGEDQIAPAVGTFFWIILIFGYLGFSYSERVHLFKNVPYSFEDEPSLIVQWYRAKKDKICPMLEFEDE